jgi:hypothetical protein
MFSPTPSLSIVLEVRTTFYIIESEIDCECQIGRDVIVDYLNYQDYRIILIRDLQTCLIETLFAALALPRCNKIYNLLR